jgi:molybdate transport system substrate-binding protein
MTHPTLRIISAGAAQGLVRSLEMEFVTTHANVSLSCSFGAVGAMKEIFLQSLDGVDPAMNPTCDVMISSQVILDQLTEMGHLLPESRVDLGLVSTGLARPSDASEGPSNAQASKSHDLAHVLQTCSAFYVPDTEHSTAGIHLKKVIERLGLWPQVQHKVKSFPNGALAMKQLAEDRIPGAWGSTQKTEILYTPGVTWMGTLPSEHALDTLYQAALCPKGHHLELAKAFVNLLTHPEHQAHRERSGFESPKA